MKSNHVLLILLFFFVTSILNLVILLAVQNQSSYLKVKQPKTFFINRVVDLYADKKIFDDEYRQLVKRGQFRLELNGEPVQEGKTILVTQEEIEELNGIYRMGVNDLIFQGEIIGGTNYYIKQGVYAGQYRTKLVSKTVDPFAELLNLDKATNGDVLATDGERNLIWFHGPDAEELNRLEVEMDEVLDAKLDLTNLTPNHILQIENIDDVLISNAEWTSLSTAPDINKVNLDFAKTLDQSMNSDDTPSFSSAVIEDLVLTVQSGTRGGEMILAGAPTFPDVSITSVDGDTVINVDHPTAYDVKFVNDGTGLSNLVGTTFNSIDLGLLLSEYNSFPTNLETMGANAVTQWENNASVISDINFASIVTLEDGDVITTQQWDFVRAMNQSVASGEILNFTGLTFDVVGRGTTSINSMDIYGYPSGNPANEELGGEMRWHNGSSHNSSYYWQLRPEGTTLFFKFQGATEQTLIEMASAETKFPGLINGVHGNVLDNARWTRLSEFDQFYGPDDDQTYNRVVSTNHTTSHLSIAEEPSTIFGSLIVATAGPSSDGMWFRSSNDKWIFANNSANDRVWTMRPLQLSTSLNYARNLVLYEGADNDHQYTGFSCESTGRLLFKTFQQSQSILFQEGNASPASRLLMKLDSSTSNTMEVSSFPGISGFGSGVIFENIGVYGNYSVHSLNEKLIFHTASTGNLYFRNLLLGKTNISIDGTIERLHGFDFNSNVWTQISNIDSTTLDAVDFVRLSTMQNADLNAAITLGGLTVSTNATMSTINGVDPTTLPTKVASWENELGNISTTGVNSISSIGSTTLQAADWEKLRVMQSMLPGATPQFVNITFTENVNLASLDGIVLSVFLSNFNSLPSNFASLTNDSSLVQISKIGTSIISTTDWNRFLDAQDMSITATPTLGVVDCRGNVTVTGLINGKNVGDLKADFDLLEADLNLISSDQVTWLNNMNSTNPPAEISAAQWGYLSSMQDCEADVSSPTFGDVDTTSVMTTSNILTTPKINIGMGQYRVYTDSSSYRMHFKNQISNAFNEGKAVGILNITCDADNSSIHAVDFVGINGSGEEKSWWNFNTQGTMRFWDIEVGDVDNVVYADFEKLETVTNTVPVVVNGLSHLAFTLTGSPDLRIDYDNFSSFAQSVYIATYPAHKDFKIDTTSFSIDTTGVSNFYMGSTVDRQGRIFFAPHGKSKSAALDYYLADGNLSTFVNNQANVWPLNAFKGACYHERTDRVYFAPTGVGYVDINWGMLNVAGAPLAYAFPHSLGVIGNVNYPTGGGYSDIVYDPFNDYCWLIPFESATLSKWHYFDMSVITPWFDYPSNILPTVVPYDNEVSGELKANAYVKGRLIPEFKRIYLVPGISTLSKWHYIDLETRTIVSYDVPTNGNDSVWVDLVTLPLLGRSYLIPATVGAANWLYLDHSSGQWLSYAHGLALTHEGVNAAVYFPVANAIVTSKIVATGTTSLCWDGSTGIPYLVTDTNDVVDTNSLQYNPALRKVIGVSDNQTTVMQVGYINTRFIEDKFFYRYQHLQGY